MIGNALLILLTDDGLPSPHACVRYGDAVPFLFFKTYLPCMIICHDNIACTNHAIANIKTQVRNGVNCKRPTRTVAPGPMAHENISKILQYHLR